MKLLSSPNQINLGLERVTALLERVGNPHLKLPPTIHLAGTNGKGSTLAFLRAIFEEIGLKVHAYTSPHLVKFNERIVICGAEIADNFLQECLDECRTAAEKKPQISVTFFEETTVAAFLAFSRRKADLLLLETGLGGRLDATNVLPKVLASIITPIDFDHMDFLGKTLPKIAFEKAGIFKKNCPVFVGKQKKEVLQVLENKACELGCKMMVFGRDFKIKKQKNEFLFEPIFRRTGLLAPSETFCNSSKKTRSRQFLMNVSDGTRSPVRQQDLRKISLPLPSLEGQHQIDNAALAVACAQWLAGSLKFSITEKNLKSALIKTFWPARLEKISAGKFFEMLPKNCELYLDGSHNLQGAVTVQKFLSQKKNIQKNCRKILIFAMMNDKNCEGFLEKIAPEIDEIIALNFSEEPRAMKPEKIAKITKKLGVKTVIVENFDEAFAKISYKREPALVLVCGSLYLAGNFLKKNCKLEKRF